MKLKDIKNLPRRERDVEKIYDGVMIVNSWKKHDSWWAIIYIVWLDNDGNPIELAAGCDDINIIIPDNIMKNWIKSLLSMDCFHKGNFRIRSKYGKIRVWKSLSSTEITLILESKYT